MNFNVSYDFLNIHAILKREPPDFSRGLAAGIRALTPPRSWYDRANL